MEDNSKEVIELLDKSDKGIPYATSKNFFMIFRNDLFFSNVWLDTMRMQACRISSTGKRIYWEDADDALARMHIEEHYYGLRSAGKTNDAFLAYLSERKFSPVQELIKGIVWDGQPHCKRFFIKWLLADDNRYTEEVSRIHFRQMIDRAFHPGCKADNVVVLKGIQGSAKSTICRWLALEDELYASVATIDGQKGYEAVQGKYVCELEELLATVGEGTRKDSQVKAFISGQSDHYRRPYDRRASDNPRTCVFIGTTNRSKFLSDPTGNRRWFPIECHLYSGTYVFEHEEEVKHEIRQCLAEMYHAFTNKLPLASPLIDGNLAKTVAKQQENSEMEDYRIGKIENYIAGKEYDLGKEYVCCAQIWEEALHIDRREMTKADANEIGELLRLKLCCPSIGKKYCPAPYGTQHAYDVTAVLEKNKR